MTTKSTVTPEMLAFLANVEPVFDYSDSDDLFHYPEEELEQRERVYDVVEMVESMIELYIGKRPKPIRGGGDEGDDPFFSEDGLSVVAYKGSHTLQEEGQHVLFLEDRAFYGVGNDEANIIEIHSGSSKSDGRAGNDLLIGGDRNDIIIGGEGIDLLIGNAGRDQFYLDDARDIDYISDFAPSQGDKIILSENAYGIDSGSAFDFDRFEFDEYALRMDGRIIAMFGSDTDLSGGISNPAEVMELGA